LKKKYPGNVFATRILLQSESSASYVLNVINYLLCVLVLVVI